MVQTDRVDPTAFIAERAKETCIGAICRPDLTFGFLICSQYPSPDIVAAKRLSKVTNLAQINIKTALRFVPLKKESIELAVFANVSFASNSNMPTQLGFVIALRDCDSNTNIFHYSSIKSERATRVVLAAKLFVVV